ncbi:serine/threonine-protein kinase [Microlunatus flavus]|uniref:non-specific serine/threonine protein kinase n=1 Tax=Microlunatus flavus TaxID=1036181 RepID=A0A1H9I676_9ACTN|nr:serine/threonine-protein kinase [Microlunatus flavus]SEQ70076.1 serine/threonine-protein kinase PknG [Microlunatus flavus]
MSTTALGPACTQPGCTGTIVDGWCDVCGSPAASPPPALVAAGRCAQPGCTGTVVDGWCDVCGSPAAAVPGQAAAQVAAEQDVAAGQAAGAVSTRTRGSSRLGSTALGSSRLAGEGSRTTRRVGSGSQRLRAARLGAGLTRVPPAPVVDAAHAVLTDASVPEAKRFCARCGKPVGRSRDDRPGRPEGFCSSCGAPYSFTPKLRSGDLVGGQYEVAGALAHGGLGWIYLARDKNVSDRWVVLKGLLNSGDPDALAAAIAERQFLAAVEHPLIVEIYNFVSHEGAGYIVMEYVGGVSLKEILKERMRANGGTFDPLPVDQALAYVLEVLPAFTYLHDLGLLYCDFKPDNLIQVGDAVKLIDLGGVRRVDDQESAIYGTVGYQAPEVARLGPSVASDIYTIGRTLAVLMTEFRGYQTTYVASLPPADATPVFATYDSLHRLLLKACAPDPADRFSSADELRVQLLGVLREVVASRTTGTALTSAASVLFEAPAITGGVLEAGDLPALRVDTTDAQHAWLSNISVDDPAERITFLQTAPALSPEVLLAQARAALELGRPDLVAQAVDTMLRADPWEWRAVWMSGLSALAQGDTAAAQAAFNAVYGQVPGELAPKLALALACERGGEPAVAEALYTTCASTDANYVAAGAFGLARVRAARGDVPGAVAALDLVPSTSRAFSDSRRLRAVTLAGAGADLPRLSQALESLDGVRLDPHERSLLTAGILERALSRTLAVAGPSGTPGPVAAAATVGRYAATPDTLRDGLEATYRELARSEADEARSHAWVDRANAVRRWTLR